MGVTHFLLPVGPTQSFPGAHLGQVALRRRTGVSAVETDRVRNVESVTRRTKNERETERRDDMVKKSGELSGSKVERLGCRSLWRVLMRCAL